MSKNNLLIKGILATFLAVLILLVPLTFATGSSVITYNNEQKSIEYDNNLNHLGRSLTVLRIIIKIIKLRFNDKPEIVSQCQQLLTLLKQYKSILLCMYIALTVNYLSKLLSYLYDHDFDTLGDLVLELKDIYMLLWYTFCDESPIPWKSGIFTVTHDKTILTDFIQTSKASPCPCME